MCEFPYCNDIFDFQKILSGTYIDIWAYMHTPTTNMQHTNKRTCTHIHQTMTQKLKELRLKPVSSGSVPSQPPSYSAPQARPGTWT